MVTESSGAPVKPEKQQILACESGVADVIDPLAGSYYIESLTSQIEDQVTEYLAMIESHGGMLDGYTGLTGVI